LLFTSHIKFQYNTKTDQSNVIHNVLHLGLLKDNRNKQTF